MTTERTPRPPSKNGAPARPQAGVRSTLSDAMARLLSRDARGDGEPDPGAGRPMSDAELREAFLVASLTVTPAPLGRSARERPGGGGGEPRPPADPETLPDASLTGVDEPRSSRAPGAVEPSSPSTNPAGDVDPADPRPGDDPWAVPSTHPFGPPPSPAADRRPATDSGGGERSAAEEHSAAGTAEQGALAPVPDPSEAGPPVVPGNLAASAEDFFGGLVRRIERRP